MHDTCSEWILVSHSGLQIPTGHCTFLKDRGLRWSSHPTDGAGPVARHYRKNPFSPSLAVQHHSLTVRGSGWQLVNIRSPDS